MHRIDSSTAAPGNLWQDQDPGGGFPPTTGTAAWCNDVQENLTRVIEFTGAALTKGDYNQLLLAIQTISGTREDFQNRLHNGNFRVWQRGASFAIGGVTEYGADRWGANRGDGTADVTREDHTEGQTDVPGNPKHYLSFDQTATSTTAPLILSQNIEEVGTFAGETATLSFWAKCAAGTVALATNFRQDFGSGGSGDVNTAGAGVTVTTTWTRYEVTVAIPSISGKTIGATLSNEGFIDNLNVEITGPVATTFVVDFSNVQFERGSSASEFEDRQFATELALCKRYFQKTYSLHTAPGTVTDAGALHTTEEVNAGKCQMLKTYLSAPMRCRPIVTWYSPTTGTAARVHEITGAADRTVSANTDGSTNTTGFPTVSGTTGTKALYAHFAANGELWT